MRILQLLTRILSVLRNLYTNSKDISLKLLLAQLGSCFSLLSLPLSPSNQCCIYTHLYKHLSVALYISSSS